MLSHYNMREWPHRPISNLSVVSKLLEMLVARQLMDYMRSKRSSTIRPVGLPSIFIRPRLLVLRVLLDILKAVDSGDMAGYLSAALILSITFCYVALILHMDINGTAIQWFSLCIGTGRSTIRSPWFQSSRPSLGSYAVWHKDRCWGLSCSFCTPPT
jgi:hypothetical protein